MDNSFDVVLVGSGHNGLIAAAYLAKAGCRTLVLERNEWLGGGVVTQEILLPGFRHDIHSSAHVYIQANPVIRDDELGLIRDHGLRYVYPEAVFSTVFEDGGSIVTYQDVERTCQSIAAFSAEDARAYRHFAARSAEILPLVTAGMFAPPVAQGPFWALLDQSAEGRALMQAMHRSVYDLVTEFFTHEKVIIHLLKFASEALVAPHEKGTGMAFFLMPGFVHNYPPGLPVGGSGALADALVACLRAHGAEFRTGADVTRVLVENGRAVGVELAGGERIGARTAVVAMIHPWLLGQLVPSLPEHVTRGAARVHLSSYAPGVAHFALSEAPVCPGNEEAEQALLMGIAPGRLQDLLRVFDSFRYQEWPRHLMMTALVNSRHDPSRAPSGKATLCLWGFMPFALDGDSANWQTQRQRFGDSLLEQYRRVAPHVSDAQILARRYDTPLDIASNSPSFQHGDVHGIGPYLYQFGGHRPTPELARYAVPGAERLYLAGCFMHPGGGVFGGGRATAMRICEDLGIDFDKLRAPHPSASAKGVRK